MADRDIGDVVTVTGTFRNAAGALANPTAVTLRVRAPDGTTTLVAHTVVSTGIYTADILPNQAGAWYYRWLATGVGAADQWGSISVRRTRVP